MVHIDDEPKFGPISVMWIAPSHDILNCKKVGFWAYVDNGKNYYDNDITSKLYKVDTTECDGTNSGNN